ncbi:tetratricopeptide repeat protein [Mucisphaera calidilacus]|uniref:Tetratricopeptide repeat protein n=1 Tax=Mucisphaera calidilacus TaxID=2527982 RepID=A0A518C158_9BACT|nr:tetratricopeptide repeat protein [Mucisphaera calidilacus]QDU72967.1 hypothetical protein Pan265_28450 [Mucisphaera calidilacus]
MRSKTLLAACLALGCADASAQIRSGQSGRALDANMRAGSGGINQVEGQVDYAARNNIVTGNVTDFSQFRGSINYSAAGEFSDSLGSNSLFQFQANSYGSSLGSVNTSLVPARAQGYTTGVAQPYSPPTGSALRQGGTAYSLVPEGANYRVYGTTNSPGAGIRLEQAAMSADAAALARFRGTNGEQLAIQASPLTGVRRVNEGARQRIFKDEEQAQQQNTPTQFLENNNVPVGTDAGAALLQPNNTPRIGRSSILVGSSLAGSARSARTSNNRPLNEVIAELESSILSQKAVTQFEPGQDVYADIVRRLATPATPDNANLTQGNQLKEPLTPTLPDELKRAIDEPGTNRVEAAENAFNVSRGLLDDTLFGEMPEQPEQAKPEPELDEAELDALESFVNKIAVPTKRFETLASEREDRFNNLMKQGEQQLANGEFFVAERTYRRALDQNPGHPMARVGLIHAQMAAGMVRSAAANLRGLFNDHPELLTVRYGPEVLPPAKRINWIQAELQRSIAAGGDQSRAGLLLGYLGYQLESRQLVRYGLAVSGAAEPNDDLIPLLQRLWLPQRDTTDAPTMGVE